MSRQDKLTPQVTTQGPEGPDDDFMMEVNFRLRLDEAADLEAELLRIRARRQPSQKELRRLARRIYDARRLRDKLLDKKLFGEPAWDMLLALYHLPALGHMLTTTGLCCCCSAPPTTALRWVSTLVARRLIERGPHLKDGRMHLVRLTDEGRALLDRYLARLLYCERAASLDGHL